MKPCYNLHLEVEVPDPNLAFLVLDRDAYSNTTHTLAPDTLPSGSPQGDTFVYSHSQLDSDSEVIEGIGDTAPDHIWLDLITDSTNIEVTRGVDVKQGVVAYPVAGTLVAEVRDAYLDALKNTAVAIGKRLRLRAGKEVVFQGAVKEMQATYDVASFPKVEVVAVDAVAKLNSIQMGERPEESYLARILAAATAAEVAFGWDNTKAPGHTLTKTSKGKSALDVVKSAQDSEGSLVWVDRKNRIHTLLRGEEVAGVEKWLFSNNHSLPNHLCLSAYQDTQDTAQVINTITFRNEEWDDSDADPTKHKFINVDYDYISPNSQRYYGVANFTATTNLDPSELPSYADYIFQNFDEAQRKVEALAFPLDDFTTTDIPAAAFIEVADPVKVVIDDFQAGSFTKTQRVAKVSHQITPQGWDTQLQLI